MSALATYLLPLIGRKHTLSGKSRRDGANLRKVVTNLLLSTLPAQAGPSSYSFSTPPRQKGMVKIRREWLDTYMVTADVGTYNLQVWNRDPLTTIPQVIYKAGGLLAPVDVRYALVNIDKLTNIITAIALMTPTHIATKYGRFGKPTIKYQAMISPALRTKVKTSPAGILVDPDTIRMQAYTTSSAAALASRSFRDVPKIGDLLDIQTIANRIQPLVGTTLAAAATKVRGQQLEMLVARALGYVPKSTELGIGGYPDIPNQALELKLQDSPTVDLGLHTTMVDEEIYSSPLLSTRDIRYCIAITDGATLIEGFLLVPGATLETHLTYVGDTSFKRQRSIPVSVFSANPGIVTINF